MNRNFLEIKLSYDQAYSRQVFLHLTHLKNLVSASSVARICASQKYALLLPHLGHVAEVTGQTLESFSFNNPIFVFSAIFSDDLILTFSFVE